MFFWRGFARVRGRKTAHSQFTKVHQWNPSESRHWSFLSRSLPLNKPFSFISNPAFTEANKALEHLQKTSEKRGNIASVLEPRDGKKPTSNEQMKKLFDSAELERAESKNPAQLQRTT